MVIGGTQSGTWARIRKICCSIATVCLLLALASCAAPRVEMKTTRPAKYPEAARLRSLAIMPFNGRYGDEVAAQLEASLAQIKIEGESYFNVTGSRDTSRGIMTRSAAPSGVELQQAVQLGRRLGVAGVFAGDVLTFDVARNTFSQERLECLDKKCKNKRTWTVSCEKMDATVEVAPRLIDVVTGNVVYSSRSAANRSEKGCADQGPMTPQEKLLGSALQEAIGNITRDVAPYTEVIQIRLKDELYRESGSGKERFASGIKFMRAGDRDRACKIWSDMEIEGTRDANMTFNLAACSEISGDLQMALDRINRGYEELTEPDPDFLAAKQRLQTLLNEKSALAKQQTKSQ